MDHNWSPGPDFVHWTPRRTRNRQRRDAAFGTIFGAAMTV
jgi:hypothetical protein